MPVVPRLGRKTRSVQVFRSLPEKVQDRVCQPCTTGADACTSAEAPGPSSFRTNGIPAVGEYTSAVMVVLLAASGIDKPVTLAPAQIWPPERRILKALPEPPDGPVAIDVPSPPSKPTKAGGVGSSNVSVVGVGLGVGVGVGVGATNTAYFSSSKKNSVLVVSAGPFGPGMLKAGNTEAVL